MKLNPNAEGIIVEGEDYQLAIGTNGMFKELIFVGKAKHFQTQKDEN